MNVSRQDYDANFEIYGHHFIAVAYGSIEVEECVPDVSAIIRSWVLEESPKVSSVNSLLKKLNPIHPELPLDYRTLLKTPQNLKFHDVNPGLYHHFGLKCK